MVTEKMNVETRFVMELKSVVIQTVGPRDNVSLGASCGLDNTKGLFHCPTLRGWFL